MQSRASNPSSNPSFLRGTFWGKLGIKRKEAAAMKRSTVTAATLILTVTTATAQTPYAGMQTRSIKALSEQQLADLEAGRGMGMAIAAELNGYPGPSHVLELADKLDLTVDQRGRFKALFNAMKAEALPIGSALIEQEAALDKQFASRAVTSESLKVAIAWVAVTQGELREIHLKYHLSTADILTASQMKKYAELRGYTNSGGHQKRHHD
jgi:hypothetical protein